MMIKIMIVPICRANYSLSRIKVIMREFSPATVKRFLISIMSVFIFM
jgi:hypothetical protein